MLTVHHVPDLRLAWEPLVHRGFGLRPLTLVHIVHTLARQAKRFDSHTGRSKASGTMSEL